MYVENERGEESPGLGGCIAWCGSGALEEKQAYQDGRKETEARTYHGGERK